MAGRLSAIFAALLVAAAAARAQSGDALRDPMRPPAGLGDATAAGSAEPAGSALQAVILRHGAKPVALLGGQRLTVGSRYGDGRVESISDSEIVLIGRSGRQVIRLNPEVSKKPARDSAPEPQKNQRRTHPAAKGESPQ